MKTNIMSVDTKKLILAIRSYGSGNPRNHKYLIMSEETLYQIKCSGVPEHHPSNRCYDVFCGTPIAICNKLPYGEVEII